MSDAAQSQAIMFEPTDELELRAGQENRTRRAADRGGRARSPRGGPRREEGDQLEPGQKVQRANTRADHFRAGL